MKNRFYLIVLLMFSASSYAGNGQGDIIEEFFKSRQKMIEQLHKSFDQDFDNDSFFSDFSDMLSSDFSNSEGQGFKLKEKDTDKGIEVTITPEENANVDVINKGRSITIKSKVTTKTNNSQSMAQYSRSISAPPGYEIKGPENKGKDIIITMVPKDGLKHKPIRQQSSPKSGGQKLELIEKVPVEKARGEETI